MAAIFNNSRWLPLMRSNMTANAPHHLYKNLKFSELSKFSDVRNSPPHFNYRVREPHVSHTGINVCAHCPLHLPKKVRRKPSVNHIGSSTSHQICLSYEIPYIRWQPSLIIQDGYHSWDPIWLLILPTTFIKNWSFPNFPSFLMFEILPLLHVNYRVREAHVSQTGINVCAHCPLHLPEKVRKKPSVNHIGSSTSHQWNQIYYCP